MKGASVFISIPQMLDPVVRAAKFSEPLDNALSAVNAGRVNGGGTDFLQQTSQIDVSLKSLVAGLAPLRTALTTLKVPVGTQLRYKQGKRPLADELDESGWSIGLTV